MSIEYRNDTYIDDVLIDSWREMGYNEVDCNRGTDRVGISKVQWTQRNGKRESSNTAFIRPIRSKRRNLTIKTDTYVSKVIIDPKTKTAIGIEYISNPKGPVKKVFARKEVIVSTGALETPKILMVSGIGKAEDLRKAGIEPIHELPVGDNFHDHIGITPFSITFPINQTWDHVGPEIGDVKEFVEHSQGIYRNWGATGVTGFLKTPVETLPDIPDIQVFYYPQLEYDNEHGHTSIGALPYANKIRVSITITQPKSRGQIKLNNPFNQQPLIYPNFNSDSVDVNGLVEAAKIVVRLAETEPFKKANWTIVRNTTKKRCLQLEDAEAYFECVATKYYTHTYHPCGTSKMGPKGFG